MPKAWTLKAQGGTRNELNPGEISRQQTSPQRGRCLLPGTRAGPGSNSMCRAFSPCPIQACSTWASRPRLVCAAIRRSASRCFNSNNRTPTFQPSKIIDNQDGRLSAGARLDRRQLAPGKWGRISPHASDVLNIIDHDSSRRITCVAAFGGGWYRAVGSAQDLIAWAERLGRRTRTPTP